MRLIKENTMQYESFFSRLNNNGRKPGMLNYSSPRMLDFQNPKISEEIPSLRFTDYLPKLHQFENEIRTSDLPILIAAFRDKVSLLNYCKELSLFTIEKDNVLKLEYTSRKESSSEFSLNLEYIFKDSRIKLLKSSGPAHNKIIIPIPEGTNKKGIICIDTHLEELNYNSGDFYFLSILSGLFITQFNLLQKRKELTGAFKDAQHYQSKLLKDCRLSALGELTIGVSQEILSSLQIMLSSIDLLENGTLRKSVNRNLNEFINVKKHVAKIDKLLKNVIKFSEIGKENKFPLKPCSLNEALEEYIELFRPSFLNNNYEIVADLENDLPTILSSAIYLKQLFISVFSLMKSPLSPGGGYLVRTRNNNDRVQLIILSTDPIKLHEHPENIDLKVLKNLITMHEGQIEISSEAGKGAAIILNFPIKRAI